MESVGLFSFLNQYAVPSKYFVDVTFTLSMASLQVKVFGVGITLSNISDSGALADDGAH